MQSGSGVSTPHPQHPLEAGAFFEQWWLAILCVFVPVCLITVLGCMSYFAWPYGNLAEERNTFFANVISLYSVTAVVVGAVGTFWHHREEIAREKGLAKAHRRNMEREQKAQQRKELEGRQRQADVQQQLNAETAASTVMTSLKSFKVVGKCLQLRRGFGSVSIVEEASVPANSTDFAHFQKVTYDCLFKDFGNPTVNEQSGVLARMAAGLHCENSECGTMLERYFRQVAEQLDTLAVMHKARVFGPPSSLAFLQLRLRLCVMVSNLNHHFFNEAASKDNDNARAAHQHAAVSTLLGGEERFKRIKSFVNDLTDDAPGQERGELGAADYFMDAELNSQPLRTLV